MPLSAELLLVSSIVLPLAFVALAEGGAFRRLMSAG